MIRRILIWISRLLQRLAEAWGAFWDWLLCDVFSFCDDEPEDIEVEAAGSIKIELT